ncbi:LicD family protein [Bacteroides faecium]|jgi:lipopolysaccharide cholinephosphotransferase|uniref:LicD family protein n=1 Tax=Bacteroides faecium TaxID=2715212 RepID=A0A6H0KKN6_9BACE|nr:LicD family protein [Bacteroides faecium]QIU93779.1 LicD family protein [Bacteroides faecium]
MGQIIIKEQPFHFDEIDLTYENSIIIDSSIAKQNLLDFKAVLDKRGIKFLLMHGTLLGAIREQQFIKHDIDIDTCTFEEEKLVEVIPELSQAGLKLCRYEKNVIYSFIRNNVYIDVYIVNKLKGLISPFYVRYLYRIIPRKYFRCTKKMIFLGETFKIPNHSIKLLEFWYGKDWQTPISNSPSNDEDKRGTYLEQHRRFLFRPIYKIIK